MVANDQLLLPGHNPQRLGVMAVRVATDHQVSFQGDFVLDRPPYQLCLSAVRVVVYKAEGCISYTFTFSSPCKPPAFVTEDRIKKIVIIWFPYPTAILPIHLDSWMSWCTSRLIFETPLGCSLLNSLVDQPPSALLSVTKPEIHTKHTLVF